MSTEPLLPVSQQQVLQHANYDSILSNESKQKIINEFIEPNYILDVKDTLYARRKWRHIGHILETSSKVLIAVSSIFSFAGAYTDEYKSIGLFCAGVSSTLSLTTLQLSTYCFRQSKKNNEELNIVLKSIGLHSVPTLDIGSSVESTSIDRTEERK